MGRELGLYDRGRAEGFFVDCIEIFADRPQGIAWIDGVRIPFVLAAGTLLLDIDAVALAPLPDGLLSCFVAIGKNPGRFITGLNCRPNLRLCCSLAVKFDQDVDLPSRTSFRTDRAMKSADRRGAM